jgi:hypothetical protein
MLRSSDGVLILPIREKLYINVQESYIADDLEYDSCYVSEFPCCVNGGPTGLTINLHLNSIVTSGSVNVDYVITSSQQLNNQLDLTFTNTLGQITGTGITITSAITINSGTTIGYTQVITGDDYTDLDGTSVFTNLAVTYPISYTFDITTNSIFPDL